MEFSWWSWQFSGNDGLAERIQSVAESLDLAGMMVMHVPLELNRLVDFGLLWLMERLLVVVDGRMRSARRLRFSWAKN